MVNHGVISPLQGSPGMEAQPQDLTCSIHSWNYISVCYVKKVYLGKIGTNFCQTSKHCVNVSTNIVVKKG